MRRGLPLSTVTTIILSLSACGDDGPSPGGTATVSGGVSEAISAGGGESKSAGGGEPSTAGGGEGSGAFRTKADGEPCDVGHECRGGLCLTEKETGWAGGYCSALCGEDLDECAPGSVCVSVDAVTALCIKTCTSADECPGAARRCTSVTLAGSVRGCVGGCETDDQCMITCDEDVGSCWHAAEICDNGVDDDEDGLQDCEELDCAAVAACAEGIAAACRAAIDVSGEGTFTGTTDGGTSLFYSMCVDLDGGFSPVGSGSNERIFRFVAPAKGVVRLLPTAISGTFDMSIRASCDDATSTFGCLVPRDAEDTPVQISVAKGEILYLFIDSEAGAEYALHVDFVQPICGDGEVLRPEECDDGNDDDGDLCSNECVINTDVECALAAPVTTDATGSTRDGVNGLAGSCGGQWGSEIVYQFAPTATGKVTITVTPTDGAADLVLHAQSTCGDDTTELGCADAGFDGQPETLTVDVTEAAPITVVVDSYRDSVGGPYTLTITQE